MSESTTNASAVASHKHTGEVIRAAGLGKTYAEGDLRTLPQYLPDAAPEWGGLDGFYAARLTLAAR